MSFERKTWEDRVSQYPTRRKIIDVDTGTESTVDVERAEGEVASAGTPLSAEMFNDLEGRIAVEFDNVAKAYLRYEFDESTGTLNLYTYDYAG